MPTPRKRAKAALLKETASNFELLIPDTSIIIEGVLSEKLSSGDWHTKAICIHEAVVAELEAQANRRREIGFQGLEEIHRLREYALSHKIQFNFKGGRPTDFEIKYAKAGEIDAIIREMARAEQGTLVTADIVQSLVAKSKGIQVLLVEIEAAKTPIPLARFFDEDTMSVHLREGTIPLAKQGMPGNWKMAELSKDILDRDSIQELATELIKAAKARDDGFIEHDRKGSTILQLADYRIVIVRPPFSDGYEITAVRPIAHPSLEKYPISQKLRTRIKQQAEGLLIAGPPGHGKSTFASALAQHYAAGGKIVKTLESPRDLSLGPEITQYALSHGSATEITDILLLSRPDYTLFDEMRTTSDFQLYADLRLSGVGMVGVLHGTRSIDAIQRFIGRIELGVIPHVLDTVIFIRDGKIERAYSVGMQVKVPSGMFEGDLARPVVVVHDFETGRLEFEIYTYGEQTVVVPVTDMAAPPTYDLAAKAVYEQVKHVAPAAQIEVVSDNRAIIYVPLGTKMSLIGQDGDTIEKLEKKLGMRLDVRERDGAKNKNEKTRTLPFEVKVEQKNIIFIVEASMADKMVDILVGGDLLLSANVSKKGAIKVARYHKIGKILADAIHAKEPVEVRG